LLLLLAAAVTAAQNAKAMCREVVRILRTLKAKRDMTVNEARLIVSIEDPRTREQRQLGIEVCLPLLLHHCVHLLFMLCRITPCMKVPVAGRNDC
jgi:hypothetical protein